MEICSQERIHNGHIRDTIEITGTEDELADIEEEAEGDKGDDWEN